MTDIGFLFDLDGVLIDSESQYTGIWQEIEEEFPTGVENFALRIKGTTLPNILNSYFKAEDHSRIRELLEIKEAAMVYAYLPGANELLEMLSEGGHRAVIVTSSMNDKMQILWNQHPEMRGYFIDIITGDRVSHSKPDPEGYLLGAKTLGASPSKCVVFEDSYQGVKAGHAAGCYVVGVKGTVEPDRLAEYSDIVVDSLEEIDLNQLVRLLKDR